MALRAVKITMIDMVLEGGHRYSFPCLTKPKRRGAEFFFEPAPTQENVAVYGGVREDDILFIYTYEKTEMVEVEDEQSPQMVPGAIEQGVHDAEPNS